MGKSNMFHKNKKLIRYFSNPNHLSSLSKTLKPSFSLTPPTNILGSHQLHTNPISKSLYSLISSIGSPSVSPLTSPFSQSLDSLDMYINRCPISFNGLLRPHSVSRLFSVSSTDVSSASTSVETPVSYKNSEFENFGSDGFNESRFRKRTIDGFKSNVSLKQISEIIEFIRSGEDDLELKLNSIGASLSLESITGVFQVLNCERVSGLRFFNWVRDTNQKLCNNSDVCSLIIDNCGWLDDYETMICVLKEFKSQRICLTEKAFGFLPVLGSSKDLLMEYITRVIDVLNEVGGSCRGSGIWALIKMLCRLDSFEMAKFVIETTERKVSYYNILVLEKCRRCHFEEAHDLLEEMRQFGCDPNVKTYNYLLSSLCKNDSTAEACGVLKEMQEKGCSPDAITFEIFINISCRLGKLDDANQFLDRMVSMGLEPRLTTHAAFIRGFFQSRQYEEAYKYVVDSGFKYKCSSNVIYSLLASLHQKEGDLNIARNILIEMMEKGLKPNFPVYMRILRRLNKTGRGHLARDLDCRFSRFRLESNTVT
uniref:Pentatricopeptide repeat-containing protein n=1 Tax=Davidia involucrata TaxID=16924 RepID=A0A5B6ZWT8_DAVIN